MASTLPTVTIDLSANSIVPIININSLLNSQAALLESERVAREKIFTIDFELINTTLLKWAATNFQQSYVVYEIPLTPQQLSPRQYRCSDGVTRNLWDYLYFVMGCDLSTWADKVDEHLFGIHLSFSVQEEPSVVLRLLAERT